MRSGCHWAFVDREQRDELVRLARQSDCSVSRIVRRAIARELERSEGVGGLSFSLPPASRTDAARPPNRWGSRTRGYLRGRRR